MGEMRGTVEGEEEAERRATALSTTKLEIRAK
jgi:hypothetical protein